MPPHVRQSCHGWLAAADVAPSSERPSREAITVVATPARESAGFHRSRSSERESIRRHPASRRNAAGSRMTLSASSMVTPNPSSTRRSTTAGSALRKPRAAKAERAAASVDEEGKEEPELGRGAEVEGQMLGDVGSATGAELFAEEAELLPDAVDGRRKRELQAQQQVGPEGHQHEAEGPRPAMDEPGAARRRYPR